MASASATITAAANFTAAPSAVRLHTTATAPQVTAATTASTAAQSSAASMTKDRRRIWLWAFLAILAASQLYFVRELLAAFALFALAFVAIVVVVITLYMLQKSWELAITRLAALRRPVLQISPVPHDQHKPA